jgi:cysteine synthase B
LTGPEVFMSAERIHQVRIAVREVRSKLDGTLMAQIGNTPLVRLDRLKPGSPVKLYAKIEGCNPSRSVKDRIALYLLADALHSGALKPENSVLEASSGNTGIALAMLGARLGLSVVVTVPDNVSVERHKMIKAYGAQPVLTLGAEGTAGAIARARELATGEAGKYLWVAQHYNAINCLAHYDTTGQEIVEQLGQLGERRLDAFVATSGTTGTLMGAGLQLKHTWPDAEVVAVWPKDKIMGIRRPDGAVRPSIYQESMIDRVIEVTNDASNEICGKAAKLEGLLLGPSGGAALLGALEMMERLEHDKGGGTVVVLLPDWGERYLSLEGFRPGYGRRATDKDQPLG